MALSPGLDLSSFRHDLRGHANALRLNHEVIARALERQDPVAAKRALERARAALQALEALGETLAEPTDTPTAGERDTTASIDERSSDR